MYKKKGLDNGRLIALGFSKWGCCYRGIKSSGLPEGKAFVGSPHGPKSLKRHMDLNFNADVNTKCIRNFLYAVNKI